MNLDNSLKSLGIADPSGTGWLAVVFTFLLAWVVTWRLIPTVRKFALRVGWADQPNARRLNREPLPNAGGLAIYAGVIAALVLASLLRPIELQSVLAQVLTILLGGSILVLVGFIDDQFGLPPSVRLWAQIITALLLVANGISIEVTFGTPIDSLLSMSLTVLWVVGITNAINLMDGMDGLAGGISFITAMSLLGVSAQFNNRAAATLVLGALGGGALGFLRHNFHPSRIIMGDAGAYFFGYVLAATSILGRLQQNTLLCSCTHGFISAVASAGYYSSICAAATGRKQPLEYSWQRPPAPSLTCLGIIPAPCCVHPLVDYPGLQLAGDENTRHELGSDADHRQ